MLRAVLIYLSFLLSILFLLYPFGKQIDLFLFSDNTMQFKSYIYYGSEHFLLILLAHIIHVEAKEFRLFCRCFFWYQVLDLTDWILTNNNVWFKIDGWPVSMNVVSAFVMGLILLYEWIQHK